MSRYVVKCPKCEYKESVMSTNPGAEMPPCPRCEDFIRMVNVTPDPGQTTTVISTARPILPQIDESSKQGERPQDNPAPPPPRRRDSRDFGPEPRA